MYAKNIVKKFGLEQSRHKRTSAAIHVKITKDTDGARADHKLYRSIIGSLLYLTTSQPDIAYAIGICARYQADHRTSHLEAVKRILKYVHGTSDFGILYSYDTTSILVGYCDADWAGFSDDRKSTSGGCFILGNNLISWFSKKQNCVFLSIAEDEYVAAESACTQLIWMKNMLDEQRFQANCRSMLETIDSPYPASLGTHAPNVPENLLSDMDSDDLDDVPLECLSETDVHSDENELDPPNPDIHYEEVPADADNNPTVPPTSPEVPVAPQLTKRKSQQNRRNITTKTGRKKIPHNIPSIPIDGISFHHEENV
ncbi:putative mitochondrial protein [Cucumis melo var. makuwa]|nr:putative mitochondrial protein [Cucumis melo var. makuwa]